MSDLVRESDGSYSGLVVANIKGISEVGDELAQLFKVHRPDT